VLEIGSAIQADAWNSHHDEQHAALALEGKDRQKIGLLDINVDFTVSRRAGGVHVGDIEQSGIRCPLSL
jgi:hypothetical protein